MSWKKEAEGLRSKAANRPARIEPFQVLKEVVLLLSAALYRCLFARFKSSCVEAGKSMELCDRLLITFLYNC